MGVIDELIEAELIKCIANGSKNFICKECKNPTDLTFTCNFPPINLCVFCLYKAWRDLHES